MEKTSNLCEEMGGHLPEVLSEVDSSLIHHLVSGARYSDAYNKMHYPFNMPARKNMKSNIYLGLISDEVRLVN